MQSSVQYFDFLWRLIEAKVHPDQILKREELVRNQSFNTIIDHLKLSTGEFRRLSVREFMPCVNVERAIVVGTKFGPVIITEELGQDQSVQYIGCRRSRKFPTKFSIFLGIINIITVREMDLIIGSVNDKEGRPNIGEMIDVLDHELNQLRPHDESANPAWN